MQWVNWTDGADEGGDPWENDLEALKRASELLPGCYVALATDDGFHYLGDGGEYVWHSSPCPYTDLIAGDTRNVLSTAGCKVYIDAKTEAVAAYYTTPNPVLHVGGEMEDWDVLFDSDHYKFPKLKAAILQ